MEIIKRWRGAYESVLKVADERKAEWGDSDVGLPVI